MSDFIWKGEEIDRRIRKACKDELNETGKACVTQSRDSHDAMGWSNVTGIAEGSIRIIDFPREQMPVMYLRWGSEGVEYMRRLEFEHGGTLRHAQATNSTGLENRIRIRAGF